jgi:hypothetical protein
MWLREAPRQTESIAEGRVYRALKASLPKGWHAWHSLRLRSWEDGEFGEDRTNPVSVSGFLGFQEETDAEPVVSL